MTWENSVERARCKEVKWLCCLISTIITLLADLSSYLCWKKEKRKNKIEEEENGKKEWESWNSLVPTWVCQWKSTPSEEAGRIHLSLVVKEKRVLRPKGEHT